MGPFWSIEGAPPFRLFGPTHLIALAIIVLINIALLLWRSPSEAAKKRFRTTLAAVVLIDEALLHLWYITNGIWSIQTMLPLHLCAVLVYASATMLITRNQTVYEFVYFLGLAGATQALLTPDTPYEFPNWRFLSMFISHGSMVTAALYMTLVEHMRPTWRSVVRVIVGLNLYMIPVGLVNWLIGSNYLFIAHKPETASLLDVLPAWPWYIVVLELIGLGMVLLLYLPFAISDWRAAHQSTGQTTADV
jgi:hypothetical integral membrane protein (TIGR02206 family)